MKGLIYMRKLTNMESVVMYHGKDIITSQMIDIEKRYLQHARVSVFEHCFGVACLSVYLSKKLKLKVNKRSLIRGALLHDYFLYDWHIKDKNHYLHGFRHARIALNNAEKDFLLNPIEKDIIVRHMFPLNIKLPKYKESVIVCIADKICALWEMLTYIKA